MEKHPEGRIAYVSVRDFAEDFIRALTAGVAGAWRERWWKVELLLLDRVQDLSSTERARDELFHLFDAVQRTGGLIIVAADRPPSRVGVVDEVRARLESGLVIEAESDDVPEVTVAAAEDLDAPGVTDPGRDFALEEGGGASDASFDPVLGAHVFDESTIGDFPQLTESDAGAFPTASDPSEPEESPDGLLSFDPSSFDDLDDFLVDGATAGGGPAPGAKADQEVSQAPAEADHLPPPWDDGGEEEIPVSVAGADVLGDWKPTNEEVVWNWPHLSDLIAEVTAGSSAPGGGA